MLPGETPTSSCGPKTSDGMADRGAAIIAEGGCHGGARPCRQGDYYVALAVVRPSAGRAGYSGCRNGSGAGRKETPARTETGSVRRSSAAWGNRTPGDDAFPAPGQRVL